MKDIKTALFVAMFATIAAVWLSNFEDKEGTQLFLSHALSEQETAFLSWLTEYGKSYRTKEEYKFRFEQFQKSLKEIEALNRNHGKLGGYSAGLNQFADKSPEEWKNRFGLIPVNRSDYKHEDDDDEDFDQFDTLKIEKEVDWREWGAVTAVKDQGDCKSCWTFAAIGAIESDYFIKHAQLKNFSEQQILDCVHTDGCFGCRGGHFVPAWDYVAAQQIAITLLEDYPYTGNGNETCKQKTNGVAHVKSSSWIQSNAALLKSRLQYKPIGVAIQGENDTFRHYQGGVIARDCGSNVDHAVLAVGYGTTEEGQDFFIVKNSWGPQWGEKGYARIAPNQCGITLSAASVNVR